MASTAIREALRVQHRVIGALIRREFINLTSKNGLGLLLLMLEPLIFTIIVVIAVFFRTKDWGRSIPVVAFAFSGFSIMWATRLQIIRAMGSIQAGFPLLYHRHVRPTDIILAKGILLAFTSTMSFLVALPLLYHFEFMEPPEDISLIMYAWVLAQWYALTFSLITGAIAALYAAGQRIALVLNISHAFITSAFYMVDWFPKTIQDILLVFPMVNACEMMRDGMFGRLCTTYYDVPYIIFCNLLLTYIGLVFCRKCANISSFLGIITNN